MMKKIIAFLVTLALSGCLSLATNEDLDEITKSLSSLEFAPEPTEEEAKQLFLKEAQNTYKDPDSIKIKVQPLEKCILAEKSRLHIPFADKFHIAAWCFVADINAKNSFGGYVGYEREVFAILPQNRIVTVTRYNAVDGSGSIFAGWFSYDRYLYFLKN